MQADAIGASGGFTRGLLLPEAPIPEEVKGGSAKRYAVYRNNVTVGLVNAMAANFPAIQRLLGEVYFAGLAREFVQAHPPQNPVLHKYGAAFPNFLSSYDDLKNYPYLADVARLEFLALEAYHEADAAILRAEDLGAAPADDLMAVRFVAHPTFRIMQSEFSVGTIFQANRLGGEPVTDAFQPQIVLLTRPQFDVAAHILSPANAALFQALKDGAPLADAAEAAFQRDELFDFSAGLSLLIATGAFQHIQVL
jgi:Putative DNA-binding domain